MIPNPPTALVMLSYFVGAFMAYTCHLFVHAQLQAWLASNQLLIQDMTLVLWLLSPWTIPVLLFACWVLYHANMRHKQAIKEKDKKIRILTSAYRFALRYLCRLSKTFTDKMAELMQENRELRAQVRVLEVALDVALSNPYDAVIDVVM